MVYNSNMPATKDQTSIRFTDEDKRLIAALSVKLGIKQSAIIKLAIRVLADKEKVR